MVPFSDKGVTMDVSMEMADIFKGLSDPVRVSILLEINEKELSVGEIVSILGLSQSLVSNHLRILRQLKLVKTRKHNKFVYYSLIDNHVIEMLKQCKIHVIEG